MENKIERAKKLANDHWKYIEALLYTHDEPEDNVKKAEFHYITAFEHGYKHALEDIEK